MASKRESECLEILTNKFGHGKLWRGVDARIGKNGWYFSYGDWLCRPIYIGVRLSKKECHEASEL